MKLINLLLLLPMGLFAQQSSPRFEAIRPVGKWVLMASLTDSTTDIKDYINTTSVQVTERFRYVESRVIVKQNGIVKDNIGGLIYDCSDSTYTVLKATQLIDGKVAFTMDHTKDDNLDIRLLRWSRILPHSLAELEFKFLCR